MEQKIKDKIAENPLMIFSKDYCPFCTQVKDLFRSKGVEEFGCVEMDLDPEGGAMHAALKEFCGQKTVPVVFIGGEKVGGCDDTKAAAANGKLKEMLDAAGVAN